MSTKFVLLENRETNTRKEDVLVAQEATAFLIIYLSREKMKRKESKTITNLFCFKSNYKMNKWKHKLPNQSVTVTFNLSLQNFIKARTTHDFKVNFSLPVIIKMELNKINLTI